MLLTTGEQRYAARGAPDAFKKAAGQKAYPLA
jgi:hypothetical protein